MNSVCGGQRITTHTSSCACVQMKYTSKLISLCGQSHPSQDGSDPLEGVISPYFSMKDGYVEAEQVGTLHIHVLLKKKKEALCKKMPSFREATNDSGCQQESPEVCGALKGRFDASQISNAHGNTEGLLSSKGGELLQWFQGTRVLTEGQISSTGHGALPHHRHSMSADHPNSNWLLPLS